MESNRLHRGRLIDHIQLVVRDLKASENFYKAVMSVLEIPVLSTDNGYFLADELLVSSAESPTAAGELTGRHHLAFQAKDRATVDAFTARRWPTEDAIMVRPVFEPIIRDIMQLTCLILMGTTSRPFFKEKQSATLHRLRLNSRDYA